MKIPAARVLGVPPDSEDRCVWSGGVVGAEYARLSARDPNILLVDDDPFMLGIQSRMLRSMGFARVRSAGSGHAALAILGSSTPPFDVILCDLNMPGMDGIEFLQVLNAQGYCGSVILVSGEGARVMHSVQKLLDGGQLSILGALEKPARPDALRQLLDSWQGPTLQAPAQTRLDVTVLELHTANRLGQWLLHYQPQVDLRTGAFAGVEALIRWNHPSHGLVYPDQFIHLAEESGAINGLTEWVLGEAVRQAGRWRRDGLQIPVAINLSMENLHQTGFAEHVNALVGGIVSPEDITLEITESRLMAGTSAPLENLVRLRMYGFRLSVDDFGTGHSSLVQLRDVPFTELKVDRGFVRGARNDQFIRPILEGSIGIARRLGMHSVAEGVETEEEWRLLRTIGCNFGQGYFIGRPMSAEAVPSWLQCWARRQNELIRELIPNRLANKPYAQPPL